jgi:hypothetical protein
MALFNRASKSSTGAGSAKGGKGGKAASKKVTPKVKKPRGAKLKQIRTAFTVTRQRDPKVLPLILAAFFGPLILFIAAGLVFDLVPYLTFLGILVGLMAAAFVFGKRVQATAYSQVEGQLGAAAAILNNMRGDWRVTPAIGFTRDQDLVHRVIGRPGIVLVAEGSPQRVRGLLSAEKKKTARIAGETPIYEVMVGDGDKQVALRQLERHFLKLPRNIKGKQVNDLDRKFKAMGATTLPIPKGPMPTRVPRR